MNSRTDERTESRSIPIADLVHDLIQGEPDLSTLARRHLPPNRCGGPLARLTSWYTRPRTTSLLAALRRLAEERAELVISHARAAAARRMLQLAADHEHPETARKACIDLLKLPGATAPPPAGIGRDTGEPPNPRDSTGHLDPEEVRALYDRLAAPIHAEEAGVHAPESP